MNPYIRLILTRLSNGRYLTVAHPSGLEGSTHQFDTAQEAFDFLAQHYPGAEVGVLIQPETP